MVLTAYYLVIAPKISPTVFGPQIDLIAWMRDRDHLQMLSCKLLHGCFFVTKKTSFSELGFSFIPVFLPLNDGHQGEGGTLVFVAAHITTT